MSRPPSEATTGRSASTSNAPVATRAWCCAACTTGGSDARPRTPCSGSRPCGVAGRDPRTVGRGDVPQDDPVRQQHQRRGEAAPAEVAGLPRALRQFRGHRGGQRPTPQGAARVVPAVGAHQHSRPSWATPAPGSATTSTSSASALNCPARTDSCPGRPSTRNQRRCADRSRRPGLRMNSTRPFTSCAHRSRTAAARASKPGPARMNRFHGPGCSTRNQWSAGGAVPSSGSPAASAASAQRSPSGGSGTGAVTSDRRAPGHLRAAAGAPARSGRPPPSPAGYPLRRVSPRAARARPPR